MRKKSSKTTGIRPPPVDRRERFFLAGIECIRKLGIAKTNAYTIGKQLGVSQPAFYYHFENQEEFLHELLAYMVRINHELVRALLGTADDPSAWSRMESYFRGNLLWLEKYPEHGDVLFYGFLVCAQDRRIVELSRASLLGGEKRVYEIIAEGFTEGQFAPTLPAKSAAYVIHRAALGGVIDLHQAEDKKAARPRIEKLLGELAWQLLRPKGKRPV